MFFGRPVEFIQIKDRMLQFFEWTRALREIWTNGTELPKDPDPKWFGIAVGKWEGDTFVVDSPASMTGLARSLRQYAQR